MKTILASIMALSFTVACAHQPTPASDPQMEKMAQMHSDMAACLRANHSLEECHKQMMAACHEEGSGACEMMMQHMHEGGMGMMNQPGMAKPTTSKDDEHAGHHPEKSQ